MSMHENQPEPLPKTNLFLITKNKVGCRIYQYSHNLSDNAYGPSARCWAEWGGAGVLAP
jgi:hypothetical protein